MTTKDAVVVDPEVTVIDKFTHGNGTVTISETHQSDEWLDANFEKEEARREESRKAHDAMTPHRQEVLRERLSKALQWMDDNIDKWLPISMALDTEGDTIEITHSFRISDVADGEELMAQATAKEVAEAVANLEAHKPADA